MFGYQLQRFIFSLGEPMSVSLLDEWESST